MHVVVDDLAAAPADTYDVWLRLHLLSHRLVAPHGQNLDGVFGLLTNVVWTSLGPCAVEGFEDTRARMRMHGQHVAVYGIDKFPRMTDYVVPTGVRIADADRVRLGAHLAEGTTVMHEGFVNFNAGTLGHAMVEGRISAGVVVGEGTDIGGGQIQFALSLSQLPGLRVVPYPNYSGPLTITVTATSQDIDGSRLDATVTRTLNVIPVADLPYFTPDTSIIDPDTGEPFIDVSGDIPVVTAIEDVPLSLDQFLSTGSPDMDLSLIHI